MNLTATEYLTELYNAYTKRYRPGRLTFFVSDSLYNDFKDELKACQRITTEEDNSDAAIIAKRNEFVSLNFKSARVITDPYLVGHNVRITEE